MNDATPASASPGADARIPSRLGVWTLLAALIAGFAAWLVGETNLVWVAPRKVPMETMGQKHEGTTPQTEHLAMIATAARIHGVFGAALGLALGAAGGLARRSRRGALQASLIGAVLGALVGIGTSYVAGLLFFRYRDAAESDLIASMILHGAIWGALGASAALALGIGVGAGPRRLVRCLLAGALGALIGTGAFELLGAVAFATDNTGEPVSTSAGSRLLARLLVAAFIALGATAAFGERRPKPSENAAGPHVPRTREPDANG